MKTFEEYIKEGIVKKQTPDVLRSQSLWKEAQDSIEVLQEVIQTVKVSEKTANLFIKNVYDVLMECIRSKMILNGYNASGQGAHIAEVAYAKQLGLNEHQIQFLDKLRYFRNGITYYGKKCNKDIAVKAIAFMEEILVIISQD